MIIRPAVGLVALVLAGQVVAADLPVIRVGWTIPAEEAKYTMMRRPAEFPDIGRSYRIEWSQFQGTAAMLAVGLRRLLLQCIVSFFFFY